MSTDTEQTQATSRTSGSEIQMLGTGSALVTRCYNTCFLLRDGDDRLLVDAGGGNTILSQLEKARVPIAGIYDMFLTHAHTDHILGAVWVLRMVAEQMNQGRYQGVFTIHSHERALHVLTEICRMTLPRKILVHIGRDVLLHELRDGDGFEVGGMHLNSFDIGSTKEKQFGFRARLAGGTVLACLGDEPYNARNRHDVERADWLMCEAFCLYRDRDIFKPYEKHHSTALEAGRLASELGVGHLLLYHTEDTQLDRRKRLYTAEARQDFAGPVFVPDDLETIPLDCP